jgi:histidyl-tRNA synthetase
MSSSCSTATPIRRIRSACAAGSRRSTSTDQDRPNEGVFSFQDDDEQWLSLRYDLTAPLARYVAENFDALPKPYRSYRAGYVYPQREAGPGPLPPVHAVRRRHGGQRLARRRRRDVHDGGRHDGALGIPRGSYVVKVNNRKVLDGVMEAIGLGGEENAGAQLNDRQSGTVLDVIQATNVSGLKQVLDKVTMNTGGVPDSKGGLAHLPYEDAINELVEQFVPFVEQAGYESDRIRIDPSVVRGLEYYTGPVFEAELTFGVNDERGNPVRFGSVGGGGRYDGLVARFRGEPVPATGFSIGVSRLYAALKLIDSPIVSGAELTGPVVVLVLDRDQITRYQSLVARLRDANIRAELYLGGAGMKAQMRYADKRGAPCVIIQGSDERARGEVQIKDLVEGARAAASIASNEEWKAARPAQISVPEERLVEAVREILARY